MSTVDPPGSADAAAGAEALGAGGVAEPGRDAGITLGALALAGGRAAVGPEASSPRIRYTPTPPPIRTAKPMRGQSGSGRSSAGGAGRGAGSGRIAGSA